MATEKYAFIDEFGTNSFEYSKNDVSTHFIVTCIIIDKLNFQQIQEDLNQIRERHFQTGEIKSKLVGYDDKRRLRILSDISRVDFQILAFVIDKRKLEGEGFGYKPVFYKFLNGLVYRDLGRVFSDVDVFMDSFGSEKFMSGFIKYIRKLHPIDLFSNQNNITFQKSKENVLIQLADFIAGTFARIFDDTKKSSLSNNFLQVLRKRIGVIKFFPENYDRFVHDYKDLDKRIDPKIDEISLRLVNEFIRNQESNVDQLVNLQVRTLKLLRLHRQTINCFNYIPTKEILDHLNYGVANKVTEYFFRTNIIAKLRDQEILIASSKNGYKLPISMADLYDFINHGNIVILPMLNRMRKCVNMIKVTTGVDITDKEEYKEIKNIIDHNYD